MKILAASGTRADWGLLRPLCDSLRKRGHEILTVLTNMHSSPLFGDSAEEVRHDGYDPAETVPFYEGRTETIGRNTTAFGKIFRRHRPDAVLILGDRVEMLGVASAALAEGVPIIHIAGGTVSEGAIDDSIRHAISKMASLHLCETEKCRERLLRMGENPAATINAGALGVYNALNVPLMSREELGQSIGFTLDGDFLVGTLHSATLDSVSPLSRMKAFLSALEQWMKEKDDRKLLLTYPNSDSDPGLLIKELHSLEARWPQRVKVVPSLGMRRYLSAVALSAGVVGNSSSGLVEVPSSGVPTLDIGMRQRGRECGPSVWHCGDSEKEIREGLHHISSSSFRNLAKQKINPYYTPHTPEIMADAIEKAEKDGLLSPYPTKKFHEFPEAAPDFPAPKTLYLIPARGGSKGIPGKNIKDFGGKPLICHAIDHAREAGASDEDICLSTDSEEIRQVAEDYGLIVPFLRPASLSGDHSGTYEVILHALDYHEALGRKYDRVVLLQPTSPLRRASDIIEAQALWKPEVDMVVSVTEARTNPYYNAFERDEDGYLHISKGDGQYTRRQDAPKVYEYNGAVYVMSVPSLRRGPLGTFRKRIPFEMESARSVDLDTPLDWQIAESIYLHSEPRNHNKTGKESVVK